MTQTIDRTIVSENYGATLATLPDKPTPTYSAPGRIDRATILKTLFRGNEALFDRAYAKFDFPRSIGRSSNSGEPLWDETQVQAWIEQMRVDVKALATVLK
jgi:hypothetical protein